MTLALLDSDSTADVLTVSHVSPAPVDVSALVALLRAGHLVQGVGFDGVRGGLIGCVAGAYAHGRFAAVTGWPLWLVHVVDRMFEGLPSDEAPAFAIDFMQIASTGDRDVESIRWKMAAARHERHRTWLQQFEDPYARLLNDALAGVIDLCASPEERAAPRITSVRKKILAARDAARRAAPKPPAKPTPGDALRAAAKELPNATPDEKAAKKLANKEARLRLNAEAEEWSARRAAPKRAIQITISAEASLETFYSWPLQSIVWSMAWAMDVAAPRRANQSDDALAAEEDATPVTLTLPGMTPIDADDEAGTLADRRAISHVEWRRERDLLLALLRGATAVTPSPTFADITGDSVIEEALPC